VNKPNRERELNDIVGAIYDAAVEPELWTGTLERLTAFLGGNASNLFMSTGQRETVGFMASAHVEPAFNDAYRDYYASINVWIQAAYEARLPIVDPRVCSEFYPVADLERSEFYNDFLRPQDFHDGCGGPLRYDGAEMSVATVLRPRTAKPFDRHEVKLMRELMHHLARAIDLHRNLTELHRARDAAMDLPDRLEVGVLLCDPGGRVTYMNRRARAITDQNDGLSLDREGQCQAATRGDTQSLQATVAGAVRTAANGGGTSGGTLSLQRPSGLPPLSVVVSPLRDSPFDVAPGRPAAVVFVSDPARMHEPPASVLASLFGLTPTEGRLAALMATGVSLAEAAAVMEITIGTARGHLKRIFRKTDTRRRSDPVRLVLTSPPGVGLLPDGHEQT